MDSNPGSSMRSLTVLGLCLAVVAGITAVSVFGRASVNYTPAMQTALAMFGLLVIASAGWISVSRLGYRLRWAPVVGLLLSLGSHWSLFVVHEPAEIPPLVIINSAILAGVAFLGGAVAVLWRRFSQARLQRRTGAR